MFRVIFIYMDSFHFHVRVILFHVQVEQLSHQNENLMKQLKEAMEKESRYSDLIRTLTVASTGAENDQCYTSEKEMCGSRSTGQGGDGGKPRKKRRDRALTTGTAELQNTANGNNNSKGKLPKLGGNTKDSGAPYRHNFTRAFHCFN